MIADGRALSSGEASGPLLVLDEPVSFWGGVDRVDGRIIDVHHPQCGVSLAGTVLVMTTGRGSSSSSSVLAELLRVGHAPAAIVLTEPDPIIVLGEIAAREVYGVAMPIVVVGIAGFARLHTLPKGSPAEVECVLGQARIRVQEPPPGSTS
jgi:predicted aconitase with swiveling domain